jgi:hypothetical protein
MTLNALPDNCTNRPKDAGPLPRGYFTSFQITTPACARGCFTCTHFHGNFHYGHVVCERTKAVHVIGVPAMGCAFWQREPGVDDE